MKKKMFLMLCICLLLFTGCSKKEDEEVVYDYDYINFLDFKTIGPNGYATLDITLKDFSAADCLSETDYIAVKKVMNSVIDNLGNSGIENLSNGDVVTIGINSDFDTSLLEGLNIYVGTHQITISDLAEPKALDLFDEKNVVFYGLEGTGRVYSYFPNTSEFSNEVKENIKYNITVDDNVVNENKTVITLEASLNNNLLNSSSDYQTTERYFLANGYITTTADERTLKKVVKEADMDKATKAELKKIIEEQIAKNGVDEYTFQQIVSIQKAEEEFTYYAVATFKNSDNKTIYVKYSMEMVYVNNEINILSFDRVSTVEEKYATDAFEDATMMYTFDVFEIIEDEPVVEEKTEELTEDTVEE